MAEEKAPHALEQGIARPVDRLRLCKESAYGARVRPGSVHMARFGKTGELFAGRLRIKPRRSVTVSRKKGPSMVNA